MENVTQGQGLYTLQLAEFIELFIVVLSSAWLVEHKLCGS
jgi:hypothetical protein